MLLYWILDFVVLYLLCYWACYQSVHQLHCFRISWAASMDLNICYHYFGFDQQQLPIVYILHIWIEPVASAVIVESIGSTIIAVENYFIVIEQRLAPLDASVTSVGLIDFDIR